MSPEDQISIEDRVRIATRAGASLIRDVRPLDAPKPVRLRRRSERASRRWVNWGVPLAAAAAVVAIALTLVAVRQPGTPSPSPSPAASRSATATTAATVPRYYAAFEGDATAATYSGPLIVGDDLTGKVIATVGPPRGLVFTSVQGMSDDRTFVVTAADQAAPDGSPSSTWYLLRITLGRADSYQLTKLAIKLPGNNPDILAYAASPDGRELAIESEPTSVSDSPVTTLGIYSVSSGAELRAWTTPRKIESGPGASTLSWLSGGRQLVFSTSEFKTGSVYNVSLRALDVTGTGTDLMTASRILEDIDSTGASTCLSLHITPDGRTAICATQYAFLFGRGSNAGCANGGLQFIAVSFPVRLRKTPVLYQYRGACHDGVSYLPWTNASGSTIIGVTVINPANEGGKQAGQAGVITDGHFRPLKIAKSVSSPGDYASLSF